MTCAAGNNRCGACCTRIENFGVSYGSSVILENVNLHIHCGELTAIVGPNGAGKSTLLKAILGEIKHTGTMKFMSCSSSGAKEPVIGYVPQQLDFDAGMPVSVLDFMAACGKNPPVWLKKNNKSKDRIIESLTRVSAGRLFDRRLGELSGGELQRVMLALALEPLPDILLLDEPFSGLDRKGIELFYDQVSELRKNLDLSIILISHDFDLVYRYADRVVLLDKTVVRVGKPKDVFSSSEAVECFGAAACRDYAEDGGVFAADYPGEPVKGASEGSVGGSRVVLRKPHVKPASSVDSEDCGCTTCRSLCRLR
ncbi:MAG: metal ABC transporter ATP-binding protein, partial [Clostridiales bacterium]|nr:metal ABC transporter ATP-binding protein [Clostridiales bacterium]